MVIFFSFGSRVFGATEISAISVAKFLDELKNGPVNFSIGDRVYEVKIRDVGAPSVGYSYQFVSGTGWIDDKSFFNRKDCLVLLPSDNEIGKKNIVESTDIEGTDEYTLSSCDCYDKEHIKTNHYKGSYTGYDNIPSMYKEVMCHHQCCSVMKKYGYKWGANINSLVSVRECD